MSSVNVFIGLVLLLMVASVLISSGASSFFSLTSSVENENLATNVEAPASTGFSIASYLPLIIVSFAFICALLLVGGLLKGRKHNIRRW